MPKKAFQSVCNTYYVIDCLVSLSDPFMFISFLQANCSKFPTESLHRLLFHFKGITKKCVRSVDHETDFFKKNYDGLSCAQHDVAPY